MQCKFLPIALCNKIAATLLSTPPERPKTTLSLPNFSFKAAIVVSTKASAVQSCEQAQILTRKFSNNSFPSVLCVTSG